ncbi:MAG: MaoC/PaaZ C-terminal domain-containing protein [Nevskiales bacterium]|nr:MaoC/PaaZ C-terminal domain-containing protein [Nevskiales bacterium]
MTQTLAALPDAQRLYLRAATTVMRHPKGKPKLPALSARVLGVQVDAEHLAAYAELCGFDDVSTLPITFPHVLAGALHLHLLTQRAFPFPLLGLVHVRNQIRQSRPLTPAESLDVEVRIDASREVRQGIEFDMLTEIGVEGECVWQETSTILHRIPGPRGPSSRPAPPPATLTQYKRLRAPADIGRRYASVGRDYNPIHLAPLSAKLFGFKRHIAHGMWSLARCAALLQEELASAPTELSVQFLQPLFLPGSAALKFNPSADGKLEFALLSSRSDKVHLRGGMS